jgi:glycerol-3-phosphate dehydrogenase
MYDVAIIGAGVIGTAIARELSRYDLKIVVLDKENDVSAGTSKANSAIIHAGYDPEENTLMAKYNALGNKMFDAVCEELSVPFKRNGSLVVAFDDEQLTHINKLKQRGINNGIPGLSILSKEELLKREPAINPEAKAALLAETAGIIDPMLLTISYMENAVMNGAECFPTLMLSQ